VTCRSERSERRRSVQLHSWAAGCQGNLQRRPSA
jgi:hypothetical protein